jgi:hypothetical protein
VSYFDDGVFRLVLDNEPTWYWWNVQSWLWPFTAMNLGFGSMGGSI